MGRILPVTCGRVSGIGRNLPVTCGKVSDMGRVLPVTCGKVSDMGIELFGKNISREMRTLQCLSPLFNRERRENTPPPYSPFLPK
jgi:hypothetical protein